MLPHKVLYRLLIFEHHDLEGCYQRYIPSQTFELHSFGIDHRLSGLYIFNYVVKIAAYINCSDIQNNDT